MGRVSVYCPDCDCRILLDSTVSQGQRFACWSCEVELEVISVKPYEIDWADDWDDDYDEEEDWKNLPHEQDRSTYDRAAA